MRRRTILPLLLLSACTTTAAAPTAPPAASTPVAAAPAAAASTPATTAAAAASATGASAEAVSFESWRRGFVERLAGQGFDRAFLERELGGLTPDDRVVRLDGRQPEFSRPVGDYVRSAVSADRVAEGRRRRDASPWLAQVESRYGVPRDILIGIWAQESAFGRIQGDMDVIRSFSTLAWEGRRRAWAESQLTDALRMLRSGAVPRERLRGSWAGAMGQTQFLPENYLKLGVDFDGDGRVDLWGSEQDALASAANLLSKAGWRPGQSWAVEAILPPGFDYALAETTKRTPQGWAALGVRRADGRPWSAADAEAEASLILPSGAAGPAFMAFPNHFVIRRYNNSTAYALAIGLLADRIKGEPDLVRPWPAEQPLSRDQRETAQRALARLGFDPGPVDGVIGQGTRSALRAWQVRNGLVADGYLTAEIVDRLRAQAGM